MPTAKDSNGDDVRPESVPTRKEFEAFATRLLAVPKRELDTLVARRHGQRKKRTIVHDP